MEHQIAFPGLGISFDINRIAFTVFGKQIFWYGIIICVGFLLAAVYASRRIRHFGFTPDQLMDGILVAVPSAIVGARLYYVIFQWQYYSVHKAEIIRVWEGGLAIYGGIIGALAALIVYGRVKKLNILGMFDVAALGLLIGQAVGRWGNFVNAEAFGGETSLPWRMVINGGVGVHPTFLYESLWNTIGFILLHFKSRKRRYPGEIFFLYIAWYGFGRMLIEGMRTDSLYQLGTDLRVSQVLAGLSCIIAIYFLVRGYRRHKVYAVPPQAETTERENET